MTYTIKVNINDLIMDLISKLIITEDLLSTNKQRWNYNYQYRLISTNSNKIRELNPLKTFLQEEVVENQTIILLPQKEIQFNELQMGANIFIENNNSTAIKIGTDDHQMVLVDKGFKTGRHYFEFTCETEPAERSIIIGICLSRNDFYFSLPDPKGFWGFVLSESKRAGYNDKGAIEKGEYGAPCKIGDVVGMMLEFSIKGLDISFYVNKINMGVAFKNLPLQTYYPCAVLGFDSSKVTLNKLALFPDV